MIETIEVDVEEEVKRTFSRENPNWMGPEYNEFYLLHCEQMMNDKLESTGYVSLNQVLYILGFPETSFGAIAGWSKLSGAPQYISFGIDWDKSHPNNDEWELRFNIHGVVYTHIDDINAQKSQLL